MLVLVIVAAITFAIFFLLPRAAGQSTYQLEHSTSAVPVPEPVRSESGAREAA
ncbi:MAG: hypothetical protein J2P29_01855 [Actinobacteria bacterium]|nr:hypothetical protein [Actinomycetota bacterium]